MTFIHKTSEIRQGGPQTAENERRSTYSDGVVYATNLRCSLRTSVLASGDRREAGIYN